MARLRTEQPPGTKPLAAVHMSAHVFCGAWPHGSPVPSYAHREPSPVSPGPVIRGNVEPLPEDHVKKPVTTMHSLPLISQPVHSVDVWSKS